MDPLIGAPPENIGMVTFDTPYLQYWPNPSKAALHTTKRDKYASGLRYLGVFTIIASTILFLMGVSVIFSDSAITRGVGYSLIVSTLAINVGTSITVIGIIVYTNNIKVTSVNGKNIILILFPSLLLGVWAVNKFIFWSQPQDNAYNTTELYFYIFGPLITGFIHALWIIFNAPKAFIFMNAKPMVENVISEPMIKPPERAMGENFLETPTLMSPQHLSKPKDSPFSLSSSLSLSPLPLNLQSTQQLSAHSPLKTQQKQKKPQLQAKSQKKTQKPGQRQKPSQETQPSQKQQQNPLLLPHSQMQNLPKQKTTQEQDLDNGFDADPKQWRTPTQRSRQISNIQEGGQVGDKGDGTEHGNLDKKDTEINKNQGGHPPSSPKSLSCMI
ncbi:hypothetical protein AX774_g2483 [Zancudomyces culisetae]|uniref:Uncharacterized protein n=1 Tax=Zancudomyces culisetae TaxID=1213189 RepID=A0A1R1PSQ2_ZANCU|nr:hypothetical protein AX774_g2483 [Zancudomyces culisetae]|eukprot:OMH84000.1 hypothetical protein AX774_g2483 [Zancudomyces culisetae]